MAVKTIFLCGHQSRYGLAHLQSILNEVDVLTVVVATDERWNYFRKRLGGTSDEYLDRIGQAKKFTRAYAALLLKAAKKTLLPADPSSVEALCAEHRVPVLSAGNVNLPEFIDLMRAYQADVILSAAYPQILSPELIALPKRGAINFHPSLLPKYRGAHPHFWCLVRGEKTSGVTAHFMTERIDDGNIIAQIEFSIEGYYYTELYNRIVVESPNLVRQVRLFLEEGRTNAIPQDSEKASYFRSDREIHRRIFWQTMSGEEIYNLIRTEGAFCFFRGTKVGIRKAERFRANQNRMEEVRADAGAIVGFDETGIVVASRHQWLTMSLLGQHGKTVPFKKWLLEHAVKIGEKFD